MEYSGVLLKMRTTIGHPINYTLKLGTTQVDVNAMLDQNLTITFKKFECLGCHQDKKIYRQGHCYDCFFSLPQTADWVIKPELSTAHLGIEDRDLAYEKEAQLQPHIVYLAKSSNVKVGVTRKGQVPTRWIDQGAIEAMEIVEVPNRYLAGITEVALKGQLEDKTNWRKMLKNETPDTVLAEIRDQILDLIPDETKEFIIEQPVLTCLDFPVLQYPEKVKSLNLTKTPSYSGVLKGIKGQYLIFEDNTVFNVRNNEGFVVDLKVDAASSQGTLF